MSNLSDAVAALQRSVSDLESRVTAHEQKDADSVASLQATITALQGSNPDVDTAVASLTDRKAKIDACDPAPTPPSDPQATAPAAPAQ